MKKKNAKKLKIVIFTGYACNNRCRFCMNANKRHIREKTTDELLREVWTARRKGAQILELIGGEVTIRPDFVQIVSTAKRIGIQEVVTATNGRFFADMDFAGRVINAGIDSLMFSVHGPDPRVHDGLTRSPGSFAELCAGLANLRTLGFKSIGGNTTVVRQNLRVLGRIAGFYSTHKIRNVEYIFVDPNYGGAHNNFQKLVPRISRAAVFMKKALDIGLEAGFDQWKARYVPLCHFLGYEDHISELNERTLFLTEHWAPDFKNENVIASRRAVGRKKTKRCLGCRLYSICEGLWVEYLKRFGDGELKAVK